MKQTNKMAREFLAGLLMLSGVMLQAQPYNLAWAKSMGGSSPDDGSDVVVDASGNVYSIGMFEGTADFDPGAGTCMFTTTTPRCIYISKLDASGNFVWARQIDAHAGNTYTHKASITVDVNGDVIYTTVFRNTVDFDPGPGTVNITGDANFNIIISKLTAAGNFVWAKQLGGFSNQVVSGLETDAAGNVYTIGFYGENTDFDPGPATYTLGTASGCYAGFVSKLDASGNFVWAKRIGGANGYDYAIGLALDASANVYITGAFDGTEDFDPGAATFNLVAPVNFQSYVMKMDSAGNFAWAIETGGSSGTDQMRGWKIAVSPAGNIYYTGDFRGTFDFDPGPGITILAPTGAGAQIFISELTAAGAFVWAKAFSGPAPNNFSSDITLDALNNIYITGQFTDSLDFDPGAGTFIMDANFHVQAFFCKLTPTGNFTWAGRFEGGNTNGAGIDLDANGSIYLTGLLGDYWTVDFDPNPTVYTLTPATGFSDAFICKFNPADLSVLDNEAKNNLLIYPNPANSILNIQQLSEEKTKLSLYNMMGELISVYDMEAAGKQIDVSGLPNGMYLLVAETVEGKVMEKIQIAH
jgi:hypothetical protein